MRGDDSEGESHEQQSEAPAALRGDTGKFRCDGVPGNAIVESERQGDVWRVATNQEITEPWRQLLLARLRKLQQLGLSNGAFLPFAQRKQSCPCCAAGQDLATAWHDVGKIWHDDALAALQGKSMA
jgi:hypothetical protein